MKLSQFKFKLPEEKIALHPTRYRDESRLMVLHRKTGEIEHRMFKDILDYFDDKDVFIFNDTKVFPARLYGNKEKTGARIEVFLLRELNEELRLWDVLVDPARKIRIGNKLYFGEDDSMVAEVIDNTTSRGRTLRFLYDGPHDEFKKALYALGETPLPHSIINRPVEPEDSERFQSIFARNEGAVTAPTASLHFSRELMKRMEIKGIDFAYITLHAGLGNLRDKEGKPGYGIYEVTKDSIRVYTQRIGEPKKQWAAFSLAGQYYDRNGKAEKYPDFSVNKEYLKVKEQWMVQTGAGIYCSPAVEKDKVFVGDDMGRLTAYALKNGKKLWSFESGKRIVGTPAVSEGIVVFGSADRHIYGLNAKDGNLLWTVRAAEPVLGAVTIADGTAYIGASDATFRATDIHTGKVIWTYTGVKGYIETKPLVTEDKVIFGAWDNTLYALNKTDGRELWKWTGGLTRMHFSPAAVWPVAADGKVFITDPQRAMTAIDIHTGNTVWRTFQSMVRETIGLSEDGERIYSKTMNDSIVCYAAQGDTPRELWATNVGFGYEHAPSMQVEKEGVMFGSTKEGLIFALEGKTGKVLWKHKIGNSLISTVVPLNGHEVLFTATSGEVGLLRIKN